MKVLDYGAERKWQGLSALSVPLLPKPLTKAGGDNNGDIRGLRCILRSQVHVRKLKQIARLCPIGS